VSDLLAYPEDWQEQGWCCRECGLFAWNTLSDEMKRELHPANFQLEVES